MSAGPAKAPPIPPVRPVGSRQPIDAYARDLEPERRASVFDGAKSTHEKRTATLFRDYADPDSLRRLAGNLKQHTLEHLDRYLAQAEAALRARGVHVHFAPDATAANEIARDILLARGARLVVKSKSMATEETAMVPYLEGYGIRSVETDLGEFIVQIDGDHPSHIVKPIIHKNRREIARSFEREGLGAYDDDPTTITRRARAHLRDQYFAADAAITGGNFLVAETGRLVLVTNEGNSRFCLAATPVHIALVGIEKLLPSDAELALFLNLLGRSGTGQPLTVYTEFVSGPRSSDQPHGPEEMHVILMDNRRSEILAGDCREILRCIRCGACLNVCPVYRQASGHAYRSVYPGPVGAVLSPLLQGPRFPEFADLPKASSLCGACNEVCPVNIPIPDLLLRLRDRAKREGATGASAGTPPMGAWSLLASQPTAWKAALAMGKVLDATPGWAIDLVPPAAAWRASRDLPPWQGGEFRRWLRERGARPSPPPAPESR